MSCWEQQWPRNWYHGAIEKCLQNLAAVMTTFVKASTERVGLVWFGREMCMGYRAKSHVATFDKIQKYCGNDVGTMVPLK